MSTSVSSVTKHFPSAENGFTTTTSGSVSSGAATVGLNSVAGYTNGETVVFVIDPTDASKKQTFTGVIDTAGVQVTGVVWTAGSNVAHASGATVVDYATATHISMMTKGILVDHDQSGQHKNLTDANGNEWIKQTATASAVNEITVANAATGNGPVISATGGDTNVDIVLTPKGTGTVKTSAVNKIDWTALPLGSAVQCVYTTYSAVSTTATAFPVDDTIPQNTEGGEFMTQAITPKSTANILVIEAFAIGCGSLQAYVGMGLFQDSTANALHATVNNVPSNGFYMENRLVHAMVAGTTSSTTFKIRIGATTGIYGFNGASAGTRIFGAIPKSIIKITEYKA